MGRKKFRMRLKKERVVLSDTLPFEIPIIFTNRGLYDFVKSSRLRVSLKWQVIDSGSASQVEKDVAEIMLNVDQSNGKAKGKSRIPYNFRIHHKENDFRELSIPHPLNQLCLVEFYDRYANLITYFAGTGDFSLRKPTRVAKYKFHKDKTHSELLDRVNTEIPLEVASKEIEELRSFFVYEKYTNIHKFYESREYHKCEKKFDKLLRFDIQKCFDSIYTHSVTWAIYGKETSKLMLGKDGDVEERSFPDAFDKIMQQSNDGETNGIIIGPEFSRIFAEIILAKVDRLVENALKEGGYQNKVDYEVFRYVDDYFVFYSKDDVSDEVLSKFRLTLRHYKMSISPSKTSKYLLPMITAVSVAKEKIGDLLEGFISWEAENVSFNSRQKAFRSASALIIRFKMIAFETNAEIKDLLNFSLYLLEKRLASLIDKVTRQRKTKDLEKVELKAIESILFNVLEVSFYLYSVAPRVNYTIRLCRILNLSLGFLENSKIFGFEVISQVKKKVSDEIRLVLRKQSLDGTFEMESLYLLIALKQLGGEYTMNLSSLSRFFGFELDEGNAVIGIPEFRYFTIIVLLFYVEDNKELAPINSALQGAISKKIEEIKKKGDLKNYAEAVLLLFDSLTCPYLDEKFKINLLRSFVGNSNAWTKKRLRAIIEYRDTWFVKWKDFDYSQELDKKQAMEVY